MSLVYSDTSTYRGIIQQLERELGMQVGDISGSTAKLKHFTADINLALDDFTKIAIQASGTWQWDDNNHEDYPVIKTNLVTSQRDYTFTTDDNSTIILDVYKVAILPSATATLFQELDPFDELADLDNDIITENTTTSVPTRYGKLANGIFLDFPTSYNATNGLKLYINREASYFVTSDTTKKAGIPGIFHKYLVLRPAEDFARRNSLTNYTAIRAERIQMEQDINEYFGRREKDVRHIIKPKRINYV